MSGAYAGGLAGLLAGLIFSAIAATGLDKVTGYRTAFLVLWPACVLLGISTFAIVAYLSAGPPPNEEIDDTGRRQSMALTLILGGPVLATAVVTAFMVWEHAFVTKPRSNDVYATHRQLLKEIQFIALVTSFAAPAIGAVYFPLPWYARATLSVALGMGGSIVHFMTSFFVFLCIGSGFD